MQSKKTELSQRDIDALIKKLDEGVLAKEDYFVLKEILSSFVTLSTEIQKKSTSLFKLRKMVLAQRLKAARIFMGRHPKKTPEERSQGKRKTGFLSS